MIFFCIRWSESLSNFDIGHLGFIKKISKLWKLVPIMKTNLKFLKNECPSYYSSLTILNRHFSLDSVHSKPIWFDQHWKEFTSSFDIERLALFQKGFTIQFSYSCRLELIQYRCTVGRYTTHLISYHFLMCVMSIISRVVLKLLHTSILK